MTLIIAILLVWLFHLMESILQQDQKEGILQIWDAKKDFCNIINIKGHYYDIIQIAFSKNGKYLATLNEIYCHIWNVENNFEILKQIQLHHNKSITFSTCGKYFTVIISGQCNLYNIEKDFELYKEIKQQDIKSAFFSEKGDHLTACSKDYSGFFYLIWNLENDFEQIQSNLIKCYGISLADFSKDRKFLANCQYEKTIYIWEIEQNFQLKKKLEHEKTIYSITFSDDGKYLATCSFGSFKIWSIEKDFELIYDIREDYTVEGKSMAFSADGKYFATCCGDREFKIRDVENKFKLIHTIQEVPEIKENKLHFLIAYILNYILYAIIPIFIAAFITFAFIIKIQEFERGLFALYLWSIISIFSLVYFLISFCLFRIENEELLKFQLDCIFFYLSSILLLSYLKTNYFFPFKSIKSILCNLLGDGDAHTFLYLNSQGEDRRAYFFDYKEETYQSILKKSQLHSDIPDKFSYFLENSGFYDITKLSKPHDTFFNYLEPNFNSFFLLIGILLFKILFCFYFIILQVSDITGKEQLDMIIIIFVYIYTSFNLNRMLGNNDLRKKNLFMVRYNQFIDFSNFQQDSLSSKLDVTCPISLELWDHTRKAILIYQKEWLANLELSYFCLIIYYILVILVDLSAYFELYWIIPQDSYLLNPIIVIMCTFNFIFLSAFLLFRFYEGNKFNDTFEDLNQSLDYLIDIIEDLQTMFDYYFNIIRFTTIISEKNYVYIEIANKINKRSDKIIQDQVLYEGRKYGEEQISELKKNILMNIKVSLEKVKKSANIDSNLHKYKFLNLIEINFQDTLFGLLFAVLTTLPTIIPKFINLFTPEKNN